MKADLQHRFGDQIRLITGCGIVSPPSRVPGVLACLPDRIMYKSLSSLAGGEGEIPLSAIAEVTWERSWKSRHHMAKKYRNAKVIGITTREGDRKIFVVADKDAADWEKQLMVTFDKNDMRETS